MKKSLLMILSVALAFSLSAQKAVKFTPENTAKKELKTIELTEQSTGNNFSAIQSLQAQPVKSTSSTSKILFGSARNIFSALLPEQNCMSYNKPLDVIMATSRGNDKGTILPLGTGNEICTFWSNSQGDSFDGMISCSVSGSLFRYPSGVVFNPIGNTTIDGMYSVVGGPRTATAWDFTYLGSKKQDGTNAAVIEPETSADKELVRQGMTACDDGTVHICTMRYSSDYKVVKGVIYNGVFNTATNAFDWTEVILPLESFNAAPDQTLDCALGWANMAWSKDGSVGYLMFRGVDARSTTSKGFYPVLYKSVDKGLTWQLMDYFDFSIFPVVFDHIWSTLANPDKAVPYFGEADIVVDAYGNPHIFGICQGQYSQHPDSLGYTFLYEVPSVFEFSYEHDTWYCHYIDHCKTRDVSSENSPYVYSSGNIAWDMRIQASRTDDGTKVFAAWTDTDWEFWSLTDSINLYPDLHIWGRDVNTNYIAAAKNVTFLEEGMGECYFTFISPVCMDHSGIYDIPVSLEDINSTGLQAIEPVYHYYLKGATFTEADFLPIGTKPDVSANQVSNYPNPFSGKTTLSVYLDKTAPVSITVTSLTGQQVSRVNYGQQGAGAQSLTFDGSNLPSGVYFYTLTIGDQKFTNKMIKN